MTKTTLILILKFIIFILSLILTLLGVSSFTSCTALHQSVSSGRSTIIINDTTVIEHNGSLFFKPFK